MPETTGTERTRNRARSGPGRVLVFVYGVFALSATARSVVQIATKFDVAPVPFLLSAFAAVVYIVATVTLVRGTAGSLRIALGAVLVELVGVIAVGAASLALPDDFPEATVWSEFGQGYGFVPVVLPLLGLAWLFHLRRSA